MDVIELLKPMRALPGNQVTTGLSNKVVKSFAETDNSLVRAIRSASEKFQELMEEFPDLVGLDELDQVKVIQEGWVNFYADDTICPYVSLAANGPWVITTKGAVLHDSGGYGMLGFGHIPEQVVTAMSRPQVMSNVMTASFSQLRLVRALQKEVGRNRTDGCPFSRFIAVNSGSESVSVATRISDVNAKMMTQPGSRHSGKTVKKLSLTTGFHGRTGRPAQFSHSTHESYKKYLKSFENSDDLITVDPNDIAHLRKIFAEADEQGVFIEAVFMEPVMGEGNPGLQISPQFYSAVHALSSEHGSVFLIDSIQAGIRATGNLSIVDYPGFENLPAPDMETYSKALNAGQYPMSILAMNERASGLYRKGIYGNTMTTTPRAMDVGTAVLDMITEDVRGNIVRRGEEFKNKLESLARDFDGEITNIQGTGLLFSCELNSSYKAYGTDSLEEYMRMNGIGVIHGGENSLRFTPHFNISSMEVDLVVDRIRDAVVNGPKARILEEVLVS
ncbi:MAG TPA: aminotransferase class III-fold pyridoxal phosphate-dependent enzyme [Gemmatimonadetes bacterium]|nr:aminotransferase class III-fold pyridoxal phosphate-dependent enzyme [Gemmatimonadota bacterium]